MKQVKDKFLLVLLWASGIFFLLITAYIILYVVFSGLPSINWTFLKTTFSFFLNTLMLVGISLLVSIPFGIGSAIYLTEYAKNGPVVRLIRFSTQCLSAIPSIVYGLFGMLLFVKGFHFGFSILSGGLTLALMVLPTIMSTTEESLRSVPSSYREGSLALGATKLRTIFRVVLPSCSAGIINGIILSAGRIMGETAALIFTSGTIKDLANGLTGSGRTLSVHMFLLAKESVDMSEAYATAFLLILMSLGINALSNFVSRRKPS